MWEQIKMSQEDFMDKDAVLMVDSDDNVIGSECKRKSHEFSPDQPVGALHRAFSVFIFDEKTEELLLQKRAATKITFPSVWTNTCCSHQLHGMDPSELDQPQDIATGTVPGAKHAAIRKLNHELGIPTQQLPAEKFKFLTRLHYWAADTITHGFDSPWGEHEIDYVLFFTVQDKDLLTIQPHLDEVEDCRWVTQGILGEMMNDLSLLFSPWFRIIYQRWLATGSTTGADWWKDLKVTTGTDKLCDYRTIHRFDPSVEYMGGAGNAKAMYS